MTQLLQDFLEDNVWFFDLSFAILCCIVSDTNYSLFFFWKTLSKFVMARFSTLLDEINEGFVNELSKCEENHPTIRRIIPIFMTTIKGQEMNLEEPLL